MQEVFDPELQIDVWTLGLIYEIQVRESKLSNKNIYIKMTFTSPACPYAPQLVEEIRSKLHDAGFKEIDFEFVFEPLWEPIDEVKMLLIIR